MSLFDTIAMICVLILSITALFLVVYFCIYFTIDAKNKEKEKEENNE